MSPPPLFVLGVSRSGTTMLRVILDRSPGIAIPDETFFVPQLAHRHRGEADPQELLDDVRRMPFTALPLRSTTMSRVTADLVRDGS